MTNVMVQVVKTNRQFVGETQKSFEPIIKKMKQYFTRVYNVDFISEAKVDITSNSNNLESILKAFKFTVGVQSYSNIGRVCRFTVDGADNTVTPDSYVQHEIDCNWNGLLERIETEESVLNPIEDDTPSPTNTELNDFTIETVNPTRNDASKAVDSDEPRGETSASSSDDSDSTNDPMNTSTSYIERRMFTQPNQNLFSIESMITKTEIIRILHLDNSQCRKLRSIEKRKRKRFQSKYGNERIDVVARAIRFANRHILNGGLSVKDSEMNDPSLEEAKDFEIGNENYKKGWARRLKVDGGLYGRTYIQSFKDDVELLFQRGKLNSSEKMNPAQIRESLKEKYPNRFSIPSETEIKQEIGLLFSKSKKSSVGGTKNKQIKNKGQNVRDMVDQSLTSSWHLATLRCMAM